VAELTDLIGREDEIDFLLERQRLAWKGEGQVLSKLRQTICLVTSACMCWSRLALPLPV
jgi:hypothetical protein